MTLEHFKLPRDDWYDITNWDYIDKEVYDPSKFRVVGNPTITDDGVASGFLKDIETGYDSSATCIMPNFKTNQLKNKKWKIECVFTIDYILDKLGGCLYTFGAQSSWTAWSFSLQVEYLTGGSYRLRSEARFGDANDDSGNVNIFVKTSDELGVVKNKVYKYVAIFNGVDTYTNEIVDMENKKVIFTTNYKPTTTNKNLYIINTNAESVIRIGTGNRSSSSQWSGWWGSIDLKSFSITVDGEEAFKGTKTVQEKVPPKEEIVGRLYKEALIENFNAIEAKLNELSGLTAYETQVPDFSNYNYEDVTLDSPNNKVVNLQSFLKIMNLIGVPIECRFTGKLCNKVTYYDKNMKYHTIVNQKLDDLGVDGKVYIILDSSNDTVSAVSDITDLTNKFLLGVYDNGRVYNLRSTGLVDINVLTHLCDMSVEPFFIGSLNGTKATEGIYRNGRIIGAWGRESKGAYPKDITLFDIGRQ